MFYEETHCCGLQFLTGFRYSQDEIKREDYQTEHYLPYRRALNLTPSLEKAGWQKPTDLELKQAEKRAEKAYQQAVKEAAKIPENHEGVSSIAVLNGAQRKLSEPILKKAGYKLLKRFYNPQHRSLLYLYFKDEFPEKSPDHKDFSKNYKIEVLTKNDGYEGVGYEKIVPIKNSKES